MKRALVIVLDSVGVGHAPDARDFGDEGANTMGHIRESVPLLLPVLDRCGLDYAESIAAGREPGEEKKEFAYGCMQEQSAGKDTTTGHWEIAGAALDEPFATFERFPDELVAALESATDVQFLGNFAESGTVILEKLGDRHVETGKPILYTSTDSVLQIAAHEKVIPVDRLFDICKAARKLADEYRIGRVIARPFLGESGCYERTPNRKDFSLTPPHTILDQLTENGIPVLSVGKISDIFAGKGISLSHHTGSNEEGMATIEKLWGADSEMDCDHLIIVNLVDFDMLYGHRRDPAGYARALEDFDRWLADFLVRIRSRDLVVITADHGNDPTWRGTDHTRELVPLLAKGPGLSGSLGRRESFADIAATLAVWFELDAWPTGKSFLS